jgi:hypothetical protein
MCCCSTEPWGRKEVGCAGAD